MNEKKKDSVRTKSGQPDARVRLLQAGMEVFGDFGFAAVTTRQIAAKAEVNLASIPYYFGTKEQLYNECIAEILVFANKRLEGISKDIENRLAEAELSRLEVVALLEHFLQTVFDIITDKEVLPYTALILREHINPSPAYELLYDRLFFPLHSLIAALVARLTGLEKESEECILRAHVLIGQIMGFLLGRNFLLKRLGMKQGKDIQLSPQEAVYVKGIISEYVRSIFSGDGAES